MYVCMYIIYTNVYVHAQPVKIRVSHTHSPCSSVPWIKPISRCTMSWGKPGPAAAWNTGTCLTNNRYKSRTAALYAESGTPCPLTRACRECLCSTMGTVAVVGGAAVRACISSIRSLALNCFSARFQLSVMVVV